MQLEDQIGIAASYVSSRDSATRGASATSSDSKCGNISQISDKLNNILTKITVVADQFTSRSQAVNIYNTTSSNQRQIMIDRDTQTMSVNSIENNDSIKEHRRTEEDLEIEETTLQCTVCSNTFNSNSDLDKHIKATHTDPKDNSSACPTTCITAASNTPQPSSQKL